MIFQITKFPRPFWNACHPEGRIGIVFGNDDVKLAIENKEFDHRSFQGSFDELLLEWNALEKQASFDRQRRYHIGRIAKIVEDNIYNDPILLHPCEVELLDGGHRLWAKYYLGHQDINAIIVGNVRLGENDKKKLWEKINECQGDVRRALSELKISFRE